MKPNIQLAVVGGIIMVQTLLSEEAGGDRIYLPRIRHLIVGPLNVEDAQNAVDSVRNDVILMICITITGMFFMTGLITVYFCHKCSGLHQDKNDIAIIELQPRQSAIEDTV